MLHSNVWQPLTTRQKSMPKCTMQSECEEWSRISIQLMRETGRKKERETVRKKWAWACVSELNGEQLHVNSLFIMYRCDAHTLQLCEWCVAPNVEAKQQWNAGKKRSCHKVNSKRRSLSVAATHNAQKWIYYYLSSNWTSLYYCVFFEFIHSAAVQFFSLFRRFGKNSGDYLAISTRLNPNKRFSRHSHLPMNW